MTPKIVLLLSAGMFAFLAWGILQCLEWISKIYGHMIVLARAIDRLEKDRT